MNKVSPWLNLLPLLLAYAVFVFVVSSLTKRTDGNAILYSYAVFYPILMLSGAWAVLGPGSYAVRTVCSIVAVLTIFLAGVFGFWMILPDEFLLYRVSFLPSRRLLHFFENPTGIFLLICCLGIPLICAAQLPYWFGRLIFGWQLIDESKPPKQNKINLKDILTIMAVLAVCLVAQAQAHQVIADAVEIGDIEFGVQTDPTTGETTWEDIIVSENNIEQFRQEQLVWSTESQNFRLKFVALSALVNIPCFYKGMSSKNAAMGFCLAVLYWLSLIIFMYVTVITILQPPRSEPTYEFLNSIFLCLLFVGAATTPMLAVRANGGKLVSREFFRKPSKDSQSPAPKKVVDPFDD